MNLPLEDSPQRTTLQNSRRSGGRVRTSLPQHQVHSAQHVHSTSQSAKALLPPEQRNSGIVPESKFLRKSRYTSLVSSSRASGIVPLKSFLFIMILPMLVRRVISVGNVPVTPQEDRANETKLVIIPMVVGRRLLSK
mmetsp:Transcript_3777/g.8420  ORF Transcript_3777/g.8420 Transcript_3777/m.8420 type:complete len:137 (+) Transcript_3777:575-985(+)